MRNVLKYYYNLEPETIHQVNYNYKCRTNDIDYCLQKVDDLEVDFEKIYILNNYLLRRGWYCHQIVLNIKNDIITLVNNVPYVLIKSFLNNRDISVTDIRYFTNLYMDSNNYAFLDKSDWRSLWSRKIDYIEYQVSQFGKKYPIIRQSINYYIGLAENSISLLPVTSLIKNNLVIQHKRISYKSKSYDLYNPINFILDVRVRDLSEFCKDKFFSGNLSFIELKKYILDYKLKSDEAILFFSRMLFPTYYFDCYQEILVGERDESDLLIYINKADEYQFFLSELYFFVKHYYNIPEIEWLIKTKIKT